MGWAALSASVDRVARARLGGVSVTAGATTFVGGILNRSQEVTAEGHISGDVYELNVPTALFGGLLFNDPITVNGQSFTVRYQPQPLGGGENCLVYLNGPIAVTTAPALLLESGFYLLLESGDRLLLES
jgi:hypothetical protein